MTMIQIKQVDYTNPQQAADLIMLLGEYAQDPMGGGHPLDPETLNALPAELAKFPTAMSIIAYVDEKPAGLINCFFGFSTFAAKKLINIHDVTVLPKYRGMGLSQRLLLRVESIARENDCCKLTMEVLSENHVALNAYRKAGFSGYELSPEAGQAVFWQKGLSRDL